MMQLVHTFDRYFVRTLGVLCALLLAVMLLAVGGQVVMRYVFNSPLSWSEELARYCMVLMAMLATALAARLRAHIVLGEVVPLSPRVKRVATAAGLVVVCVVLAILVWHSIDLASRAARQTTPGLGLSMRTVYAALPIGFGLTLLGTLLGVATAQSDAPRAPDAEENA